MITKARKAKTFCNNDWKDLKKVVLLIGEQISLRVKRIG
jgi:hypothetical protein